MYQILSFATAIAKNFTQEDPLDKFQIFISCLEFLWYFKHFAKPKYIALLVPFMQFYENLVLWYEYNRIFFAKIHKKYQKGNILDFYKM